MNREIKFRGRVIESGGRWAYGSLITNSAGTSYIVNSNIAPSKMGDRYEEVVNVGQYTGLKDCTGKE